MNAILIINKSSGPTSRDVVNRVSKLFNTKKVGHTGTLDPMAKGVLVITIGKYTKLNDLLTSTYKEYEVEMILGYETDTLDITGKTIKKSNVEVSDEKIKNIIYSFKGKYIQEVPKYSAVKVNGKKLYEYAREDKVVDLPKREVEIKDISNININGRCIKFDCVVSKGTYIRSLIRDIGSKLETYAVMSGLTRTKQGKFSIDNAYTLEELEQGNYRPLRVEDALDNLHIINLDEFTYKEVSNGVVKGYNINEDIILFKYKNEEMALYKRDNNSKFRMYVKF